MRKGIEEDGKGGRGREGKEEEEVRKIDQMRGLGRRNINKDIQMPTRIL